MFSFLLTAIPGLAKAIRNLRKVAVPWWSRRLVNGGFGVQQFWNGFEAVNGDLNTRF
jgi:hypothetical protein